MKHIKPDEGKQMPVSFLAKLKFSSPKIEIVEFHLKPGEKIDLHQMPMPVIFYIADGEAWALTENTKTLAHESDMFLYEPNEYRGWQCEENQQVTLLVIKMLS